MDNAYVFDSFALLAHLESETRGEKVTNILDKAQAGDATIFMSLINLGRFASGLQIYGYWNRKTFVRVYYITKVTSNHFILQFLSLFLHNAEAHWRATARPVQRIVDSF